MTKEESEIKRVETKKKELGKRLVRSLNKRIIDLNG